MREFSISKYESGQRMDKYLRRLLPKAPDSFLYKMLRKKNIKRNGKKTSGADLLAEGDTVSLFLSDDTFQKFSGSPAAQAVPRSKAAGGPVPERKHGAAQPDVLYETEDILIVNKPAGMLSQKAKREDFSANEMILQYLLDTGSVTEDVLKTFTPAVCNRLDRNTSGILVAGKTLAGLQEMSAQLKGHSCAKYYRCIVKGRADTPQRLTGYLTKDSGKNKVQIRKEETPGSRYIETGYEPVCTYESGTGYSMLEVRLYTGRPHQIRAHLASCGHPVIGDPKYGDAAANRIFAEQAGVRRLLLHAERIVLSDGTVVTAPLPADFLRAVRFLSD